LHSNLVGVIVCVIDGVGVLEVVGVLVRVGVGVVVGVGGGIFTSGHPIITLYPSVQAIGPVT